VIRKDLVFSNGDKLTADDVEFTAKLMLSERLPQIAQFANLTDVKKVDDWIMPKKYYEQVGKDGYAVKPIGTGPYELSEFRTADIAVFKKRTTEHPFRKALAPQISFRSITEHTQITNGMRTGELDFAIGQIGPDQVNIMERDGSKVQVRYSSVNTLLISQPESKLRNTPLQDRNVRLALNYAVDKEAISKTIYGGRAQANGQLAVPSSPAWDPNVKPFPYDPAMAKQLLAQAGYPNGFKLPVGIEYTPLTGNPNLLLAVQSNLRDVGIEATITSFELAPFLDKFYGRNNVVAKGDLMALSTGDGNGFATTIKGWFTCDKPVHWWCAPEFDRYMNEAAGEPDITKRGPLMQKAAAAMREDVGLLFLINGPGFYVSRANMRGFDIGDGGFFNFDSAYRIE
jgi:peptide/nickel transport system substrate-binding protein